MTNTSLELDSFSRSPSLGTFSAPAWRWMVAAPERRNLSRPENLETAPRRPNGGAETQGSPNGNVLQNVLTDLGRQAQRSEAAGRQLRNVSHRRPTVQIARPRLENVRRWEGVVLDVSEEYFTGELRNVGSEEPLFIADFSREDIAPADQHLVTEGAFFFLSIGVDRTRRGSPARVSAVRMRRLPPIDEHLLEEARIRARKRMAMMGFEDAQRRTTTDGD